MKNPVFTGAGVAIITPMYEDGSINFDELGRIVEDQIARGTDAIVICGTTGECSTMTDEEQLAAIKYTVDLVNHRVPVIAGAGSNDTDHGCALAAKSAACGADALLLVTEWKEFRIPSWPVIERTMRCPALFDGRNIYDKHEFDGTSIVYHYIGG